MGQLWGQRKNCPVAQPGASRVVAAAAGPAEVGGAGGWQGGNFGHSTPRRGSDASQAHDLHRKASIRRVRRVLPDAFCFGVAVAGVAVWRPVGQIAEKTFQITRRTRRLDAGP